MLPTIRAWNWLGDGVYFWEDDPRRAADFAKKRFGDRGRVIHAVIELGQCLDLLNARWTSHLRSGYKDIVRAHRQDKRALPRNRKRDHDLDYRVIEALCIRDGFDSVRAVFPEGEAFPGSALHASSSIMICVRRPKEMVRTFDLFL